MDSPATRLCKKSQFLTIIIIWKVKNHWKKHWDQAERPSNYMLYQSTKVLGCAYHLPSGLLIRRVIRNIGFLFPLLLQEKEWLLAGWARPVAATRERRTCGRHFLQPAVEKSVTSGCRRRLPSCRRQQLASRASRRLWRKIPRWKIREKGGKSRE